VWDGLAQSSVLFRDSQGERIPTQGAPTLKATSMWEWSDIQTFLFERDSTKLQRIAMLIGLVLASILNGNRRIDDVAKGICVLASRACGVTFYGALLDVRAIDALCRANGGRSACDEVPGSCRNPRGCVVATGPTVGSSCGGSGEVFRDFAIYLPWILLSASRRDD